MIREEAEALCARNAAEHADRKVAQWRAKEGPDGTWAVIRIDLPPTTETGTESRGDERPPTPPDPRPDVPPTVGPIF
ncbi:MAG TPA: hypothetical protein VD766_01945 [Solirubrobacterales bacterium]|nr:hypothetical protein [Solirubrobacterales bacterium]